MFTVYNKIINIASILLQILGYISGCLALAIGIFWTGYLLNDLLLLRKRYRGACYIRDEDSAAKRYEYWVNGVKIFLMISILLAENITSILLLVINVLPYYLMIYAVLVQSFTYSFIDFGIFLVNILTVFLIEVYENRIRHVSYRVKLSLVFSVIKLGLVLALSSIPCLAIITQTLLIICIIVDVIWYSYNSNRLLAALNYEYINILREDAIAAHEMRYVRIKYKRFTILLMIFFVLIIVYTILSSIHFFTEAIEENLFNELFVFEIYFSEELRSDLSKFSEILNVIMASLLFLVGVPVFFFPYVIVTCQYIFGIIKKRLRCKIGRRDRNGNALLQPLM